MKLGTLIGIGAGIAAGYAFSRFMEAKYSAVPLELAFPMNFAILRPVADIARGMGIVKPLPGTLIDVRPTFKVQLPS